MTTVSRLPPLPRPPHDPRHWRLDAHAWRLAAAPPAWLAARGPIEISPGSREIALPPISGGAGSLTHSEGTLGGLVPPAVIAYVPPHGLWLLDRVAGALRRFDPCRCRFETVPCMLDGVRDLVGADAIAVEGRSLFVADRLRGRVVVFALPDLAVRGFLAPPRAVLSAQWAPRSITTAAGCIVVADAGGGALHWFHRGGTWLRASTVLGAVEHIASDREGRVYATIAGDDRVAVLDRWGRVVERVTRREAIAERFAPLPFTLLGGGLIDLAGWCSDAARTTIFDRAGNPVDAGTPLPPDPLARSGAFVTSALDSRIGACTWHRVVASLELPERTRLRMWTFTSDELLPDDVVAATPEHAWRPLPTTPSADGNEVEALIRSAPGKYLWLAGELTGNGWRTPRVRSLVIEYPRITLRRYLPAAFAPDPISADFTDRFLAVFDRGFRDIEQHLDHQVAWFDARSAPADSSRAGTRDFLGWLASWIGLTLDRRWPEERRRRLLRDARGMYRLRGTREGLRRQLLTFLGMLDVGGDCLPGPTGRPCPPCEPSAWQAPPLVLERFQLRRWLEVGHGRLGDASRLWSDRIVDRTKLGSCGRLGATRLDSTPDPRRDPFLVHANRVTVFLPASVARSMPERRAIESIIAAETPAHAAWSVDYVEPRMRVGIQSMVGYDTVVGCYPEGIALDTARLGRGTVLGAAPGEPEAARRVGNARVGATAKLT